jgi:hypothetical protein
MTRQVRGQQIRDSLLSFRRGDLRDAVQSLLRLKREKVTSIRLDADHKATVILHDKSTGTIHFYRFERAGESWDCITEGSRSLKPVAIDCNADSR